MTNLRICVLLISIYFFSSLTIVISEDVLNSKTNRSLSLGKICLESTKVQPVPLWAGFVGCIVASVFFGSNLLPAKQFSAGDGFFFQFIYCVAIWVVGFILDLILDNQRFYPLVILGGTQLRLFSIFQFILSINYL